MSRVPSNLYFVNNALHMIDNNTDVVIFPNYIANNVNIVFWRNGARGANPTYIVSFFDYTLDASGLINISVVYGNNSNYTWSHNYAEEYNRSIAIATLEQFSSAPLIQGIMHSGESNEQEAGQSTDSGEVKSESGNVQLRLC